MTTVRGAQHTGYVVEIDVEARSDVVREVARGGDANTIVDVTVGSDGIVYYQECCEPFIGVVHRAENDWDGSVYAVFGSGFAVSPDGTRLAASRALTSISIVRRLELRGRDIRHVRARSASTQDRAWLGLPICTQLARRRRTAFRRRSTSPSSTVIDVEAVRARLGDRCATGSDGRYERSRRTSPTRRLARGDYERLRAQTSLRRVRERR